RRFRRRHSCMRRTRSSRSWRSGPSTGRRAKAWDRPLTPARAGGGRSLCPVGGGVADRDRDGRSRRVELPRCAAPGPPRHPVSPSERSMIVLANVCKSYDGGRTYSVRDVSLTVPTGSLLVLLGGSGCGKTTTLKMINRLIEPTSGRIEIDGRDVRAADPVEL